MDRTKSTGELESELKPNVDIVKDVNILFDGKQFMVKLPVEVSKFYDIKKGDKFRIKIHPTSKGQGENTFEILK